MTSISCNSLTSLQNEWASHCSSFMHTARGACVSHRGLGGDEALMDAASLLAASLALLFLSEGGSKSRKITSIPMTLPTHSQL